MTSFDVAVPVLPALDITQTLEFYTQTFHFEVIHQEANYGIIERDALQLHFWRCTERAICEASGCRIHIRGIDALHNSLDASLMHPNARLEPKPWGTREFGILDNNGNLITFVEDVEGQ